jgi:hypothetical protein
MAWKSREKTMDEKVRTLDRRYQVFISSTFNDLKDQRKDAIEVVFERGHIPIALENFSARSKSDLEVIEQAIRDSQIYMLILGYRYGELIPEQDISFTEFEYKLALEANLTILVLQMRDDEIDSRRAELDRNKVDDRNELNNTDKFSRFRDELRKHFRQLWVSEKGNFRAKALAALVDAIPDCERRKIRGFIREPQDPTMLGAANNEFIVDIVNELRGFGTLYDRCTQEAEKKRAAARYFKEMYCDYLVNRKVSLFFESGSTVAYVAKELASALQNRVRIERNGSPTMKINTNNVLAYLLFWLRHRIPCSPFPWSPPSEKTYGAWYGGLEESEEKAPDYSLPPLDENAKEKIVNLLSHPYRPQTEARDPSDRRPCLLLGAASGLQVSENHKLVFVDGLDDATKQAWTEQVNKCFGPHVGTYHNKVFKRFMYATDLPIVIFITSNKIDCPINTWKCHFILDREKTWNDFCQNHPVAFCVGCEQGEKTRYMPMFTSLGFRVRDGLLGGKYSAFTARNDKFIREFEVAELGMAG